MAAAIGGLAAPAQGNRLKRRFALTPSDTDGQASARLGAQRSPVAQIVAACENRTGLAMPQKSPPIVWYAASMSGPECSCSSHGDHFRRSSRLASGFLPAIVSSIQSAFVRAFRRSAARLACSALALALR